jgi:TM2 domain-containing membrane protein YozV
MSNSAPSGTRRPSETKPHHFDIGAALLSYLVPGLGQIYQGRVAKGLLFCVALYALFFYGMYLGHGMNVYLPDDTKLPRIFLVSKGNFVVRDGIELTGFRAAVGHRIHFLGQMWIGVAAWPAVWQYYQYDEAKEPTGLLGAFQRMPPEPVVNQLQNEDDKKWDLGWVFTVIAGVLNIMVIYDALAGPAFGMTNAAARESEVRNNAAVPANT